MAKLKKALDAASSKPRLTNPIHVRLSEGMSEELRRRAVNAGLSPSAMVRAVLTRELSTSNYQQAGIAEGVRLGVSVVKKHLDKIQSDLAGQLDAVLAKGGG